MYLFPMSRGGRHLCGHRSPAETVAHQISAHARQALHAYRLAFAHPIDGRPLSFEAPLPQDLVDLLGRLRG